MARKGGVYNFVCHPRQHRPKGGRDRGSRVAFTIETVTSKICIEGYYLAPALSFARRGSKGGVNIYSMYSWIPVLRPGRQSKTPHSSGCFYDFFIYSLLFHHHRRSPVSSFSSWLDEAHDECLSLHCCRNCQ